MPDRAARPETGLSGTEIEITSAMIEAGALAWSIGDPEFEPAGEIVARIYRAMASRRIEAALRGGLNTPHKPLKEKPTVKKMKKPKKKKHG